MREEKWVKLPPQASNVAPYRHEADYLPQLHITQPFYKPLWLWLDLCLGCSHSRVASLPFKKQRYLSTQWWHGQRQPTGAVFIDTPKAGNASSSWPKCSHSSPSWSSTAPGAEDASAWTRVQAEHQKSWGAVGKGGVRDCQSSTSISPSHGRGEKGSKLIPWVTQTGWCNVAELVVPVSRRILDCFAELKCLPARCRHVQMSTHDNVGVRLQIFIFCSPNGDRYFICSVQQLISDSLLVIRNSNSWKVTKSPPKDWLEKTCSLWTNDLSGACVCVHIKNK